MPASIAISPILAAVLLCCSPATRAAPADPSRAADAIAQGTNELRRANGLQGVERNARLESAANAFAAYMANTGRYGHEADGGNPSGRAERHGYDACIVSENIAYAYNSQGFTTPALAMNFLEGWKHSPGHRKNMLDGDVTQTAVAVARSERTGYYYAVQMFGRPKSQGLRFQVSNASGATARYRLGERTFTLTPRTIYTHTQCREEPLVLEGNPAPFTARNGERLVVVKERGKLSIRRE
jgi:uncharacterized protein YkwD